MNNHKTSGVSETISFRQSISLRCNGKFTALISSVLFSSADFISPSRWIYRVGKNVFHLHRPPPASPQPPADFQSLYKLSIRILQRSSPPLVPGVGSKVGSIRARQTRLPERSYLWGACNALRRSASSGSLECSGCLLYVSVWQVLMQVDALLCCYFFVWTGESRDKKFNLARLVAAPS